MVDFGKALSSIGGAMSGGAGAFQKAEKAKMAKLIQKKQSGLALTPQEQQELSRYMSNSPAFTKDEYANGYRVIGTHDIPQFDSKPVEGNDVSKLKSGK